MSEPTVDPAVEALAEALCEWWDEDVESHHAANLPCTGCLEIAKGVARRLPAHGVTLAANRERACCTCVIGVCSEEGECCESHDCPGTLAADREPDGLRAAIEALRSAFSGDEFEENAAAAAGEGEWSWFRWLAVTTIEGLAAHPATDQPEAAVIDAAHLDRQREWSRRTFGPGSRLAGVLQHIRKELQEIEEAPTDLDEWADVVILALDGAWRAGHGSQQIIDAIKAKQAKNEAREWPDWRTFGQDQAIEHVRIATDQPEMRR